MYRHHLPELVCPRCASAFELTATDETEGYVHEGALSCVGCGDRVSVVNGIPRFAGDSYAANFGRQWKQFSDLEKVHGTDTMEYYRTGLGLTPSDVTGKRVLEVGCGSGRGVGHFLEGHPKLLAAIDLSAAVDVVEKRFRDRRNLLVIQCDLRSIPLPAAAFDVVYSYGVLHCTPEPPESFAAVAKHVSPGGRLAVWVYGPHAVFGSVSHFVQSRSDRLPRAALIAFCWATALLARGLYVQSHTPVLNRFHGPTLRLAQHFFRVVPANSLRLAYLWAHDYHTTKYMYYYNPDQLHHWFAGRGFHDMRPLRQCGMIGTRASP